MSHFTQLFVHDFQAFLHDSLARPGTGRVELAKCIADTLVIKNPPDKEKKNTTSSLSSKDRIPSTLYPAK